MGETPAEIAARLGIEAVENARMFSGEEVQALRSERDALQKKYDERGSHLAEATIHLAEAVRLLRELRGAIREAATNLRFDEFDYPRICIHDELRLAYKDSDAFLARLDGEA